MKTNYRNAATAAWREVSFGLMAVVKYVNKSTEKNLKMWLAENGINAKDVTIDMIKAGAKPESFFTHNRAGEITGDRKLFTLGFALTSVKNAKKLASQAAK